MADMPIVRLETVCIAADLFMRDVYTGMKLDAPDMSYAFSGYYMHSAVLCSIFKVSPVIMQHNVMGIISILVSIDVVYLIGRIIFRASIRYDMGIDIIL